MNIINLQGVLMSNLFETEKDHAINVGCSETGKSTRGDDQYPATPPMSLLQKFRWVMRQGEERTKFQKSRIEAFLPKNLKAVFMQAMRMQYSLADTQDHHEMIRVIKDEIYGVLPDYKQRAKASEAKGIFVRATLTKIMMDKGVAKRQLQTALRSIPIDRLTAVVRKKYGDACASLDQIEGVINLRDKSIYDRRLVAIVLIEAAQLKLQIK